MVRTIAHARRTGGEAHGAPPRLTRRPRVPSDDRRHRDGVPRRAQGTSREDCARALASWLAPAVNSYAVVPHGALFLDADRHRVMRLTVRRPKGRGLVVSPKDYSTKYRY
jgi:hypothetical protein